MSRPGSGDTMNARAKAIIPFFILAVVGCSERTAFTPGFAIRNSAGIRIVENLDTSLAAVPHWHLGETPLVDIGVVEGPRLPVHRIRVRILSCCSC